MGCIHTVEYYSALKRQSCHMLQQMNLNDSILSVVKKPVYKNKKYDSVYMKYLEYSESQRENKMVVARAWKLGRMKS